MSKVVSFSDLLACSELSHIRNEIELLSIDNDDLMGNILGQIGFDIEFPISYEASKHRNLQNKVVVGFCAIGEIDINSKYIRSNLCSLTERIIATVYTDPSLTRQLSGLVGMRMTSTMMLKESDGGEHSEEGFLDYMIEPDYEFVTEQIANLEAIRDIIRGSKYNNRGEVKTLEEYKHTEVEVVRRKKMRRRAEKQ